MSGDRLVNGGGSLLQTKLTVNGSLGFIDNAHDLTVALDHLYLANPPHYWIAVSGQSTAQFINDVLDFKGEITADAGIIMQPPTSRPQLADDIVVIEDSAAQQNESDAVEQGTIVNLHVTLDLGKQFFLRVAGLEGQLDGSLRLQNDEKGLSATGESDIRNFYDMIDSRRQTFLRPRLDALDQVFEPDRRAQFGEHGRRTRRRAAGTPGGAPPDPAATSGHAGPCDPRSGPGSRGRSPGDHALPGPDQ